MIIIDAFFLFIVGFWINLFIDTLFLAITFAMSDKIPCLSLTSRRK